MRQKLNHPALFSVIIGLFRLKTVYIGEAH